MYIECRVNRVIIDGLSNPVSWRASETPHHLLLRARRCTSTLILCCQSHTRSFILPQQFISSYGHCWCVDHSHTRCFISFINVVLLDWINKLMPQMGLVLLLLHLHTTHTSQALTLAHVDGVLLLFIYLFYFNKVFIRCRVIFASFIIDYYHLKVINLLKSPSLLSSAPGFLQSLFQWLGF